MAIVKKSLVLFLALVLIVLGLELAVQQFSDFKTFRTQITSELATRLHADVEIDRMGLDVLPWPHLELRNIRLIFADGTVLRVPLVNLSPTLKGLFVGRPEIVSISCEKPDLKIVLSRQEPVDDNRTEEARQKDLALLIESSLDAIPRYGVTVHDGTVHITAPDNSLLVLEKLEAAVDERLQGLRIVADCRSGLWKNLGATLTYHDPAVTLKVDARDVDTVKSIRVLKAFIGEALPGVAITKNLSGIISSVSLTARLPHVSDPLATADISGRGSFKDLSIDLPEGLDVRELAGGFELDKGSLAAANVSARLGNSRIQEAAFNLDRSRGFAPSQVTAEFNVDLADVPGLLHFIPDLDVRTEIALIKNPRGTAQGTFALRAEGGGYSTEIAVGELLLKANYRSFPQNLELRRGICTYRDEVLSFNSFAGNLGSSTLPDFSLSFGLGNDEDFTAAAKGAVLDFDDLNTVLASFETSRNIIEDLNLEGGRARIENLVFKGPLTEPRQWEVSVDALLDDVSITATGFDGPFTVLSSTLKADQHACTLSRADITYCEAKLAGTITLEDYLDGISGVAADVRGVLGKQTLAGLQEIVGLPSAFALRAPVKFSNSRLAWSRSKATTFSGDFTLGEKTAVDLKLSVDNAVVDIQEFKISDKASQCKLGIKIEEDLLAITYAGMLKKDTLDRALLENRFLQGWLKGDISIQFNQKNPSRSSAKGTLAWDKVGYPVVDTLPLILTTAEMTASDNLLTVGSAGLSAGSDSAGVQGTIGFTDDGFILDLTLHADSIDVDAILDRVAGDNASSSGSAKELWETPLRGKIRFKARELKKSSFVCNPFEALVSFADKAVTVDTVGTKLCAVDLPATVLITPDIVTLDVKAGAEKSLMQEVVLCLFGEEELITGIVDIDAQVRAQAKPDALLDSLEGNFSIHARDGRIYRSGLIAKIVSFLSIRNLLSLSIPDMVTSGYAYQSLEIESAIKGQTLVISKWILISSSFTLVGTGTIDLESERVDLDVLVTPFQIHNQVLSKVPLVGGWLSKPMLGVPLKISGHLEAVHITTRTASAVTKGLVDVTKGIINAPVKIISPVFRKKPAEEH